jgi:hypothetical protein
VNRTDRMLADIRIGVGHAASLQGGDRWGWTYRCDCGRRFNAYRHPTERDHFESPMWEAHVVAMREARNG